MDLDLEGRTALIAGASRGIGYAVAKGYTAEGCNLHLASRSAAELAAAKELILKDHKVTVTYHPMDLGVAENATRLATTVANVDILVNNAGAIPQGTLAGMDDRKMRDSWEFKLFGYRK